MELFFHIPAGILIHPLREEGDTMGSVDVYYDNISIHSLREEGDLKHSRSDKNAVLCISIHSLREEGDLLREGRRRFRKHFNPLPPRGGRQIHKIELKKWLGISIHSLREEGDRRSGRLWGCLLTHFNPLPPRGGRPPGGRRKAR